MEQNHLCLVRQKSVKELRRDATQRYIDMQCNVTSTADVTLH